MPTYLDSGSFINGAANLRSLVLARGELDGTSVGLTTTGNPFTITNTNCTPVLASVGGRPCANYTNSGSTATDGSNLASPAASILTQNSKRIAMACSVYFSTTTQDFAFGLGVPSAGMIAADPTDFFMIRKLAAETMFSIRARNNSGTVQSFQIGLPTGIIAVNTWYDLAFELTDLSTATGAGKVSVYGGASVLAGASLPFLGTYNIPTQFPDRVANAVFMGWRAGSGANVSGYVSNLAWRVEA